jgi:hypothetical protein
MPQQKGFKAFLVDLTQKTTKPSQTTAPPLLSSRGTYGICGPKGGERCIWKQEISIIGKIPYWGDCFLVLTLRCTGASRGAQNSSTLTVGLTARSWSCSCWGSSCSGPSGLSIHSSAGSDDVKDEGSCGFSPLWVRWPTSCCVLTWCRRETSLLSNGMR